MRFDSPTICPDCHAPIEAYTLSFYTPRCCPECGWGVPEAIEQGRRDLLGTLALAAGSSGMVILGIVGLLVGSLQAKILGAIGVAGLILSVDRSLQAWEFLRLYPSWEQGKEVPTWCPPELAQAAPRVVARRKEFERPLQAMFRMLIGVASLAVMAGCAPVLEWERRALIGFTAIAVLPLVIRPLRITLEDWRHQRLATYGRMALGNVLKIEQPWYGGRRVRYRYLDEQGRAFEGRAWHPSPPADLVVGAAMPVLYRHGDPGISVPYPAGRYEVAPQPVRRRAKLASV